MADTQPTGSVTEFVQAILEITAPITQMLDHMMRAPDQPDIREVVETTKHVLEDVLTPLVDDADLRAATRLVDTAATLVLDGVYSVPHPNRRERRRSARRRSH
jgi:hypothetical protein